VNVRYAIINRNYFSEKRNTPAIKHEPEASPEDWEHIHTQTLNASPERCRKSFTIIFLGDHDIPLTDSNFGILTAFRAIFSHIFTAHAQERPLMNFRLKF